MRSVRRRSAVSNVRRVAQRRESEALILRLRQDAEKLATHFELQYKEIVPERANVRRRYGICYDDGLIAVRLRNIRSGEPLKYSSLVDTLCHELAHLRHFNHGPRFRVFYAKILEYARGHGIYQPGKRGPREWVQMSLFHAEPGEMS